MGTAVTPGGGVFYNWSANVTLKEVRVMYVNILPLVRDVHLPMDSLTIRIEFGPL